MTLWPGAIYPSHHRAWTDKLWNVLAGGPSVWDTPRFALLQGPTVAINRAIWLQRRLPIDVWACWDPPHRLGITDHQLKGLLPGLEVWTNPLHVQHYRKLGAPWVKPMPLGLVWNEIRADMCIAPCLWMALDHMEHLGGRHFRVFGMDNAGTFTRLQNLNRWARDATVDEERRWIHERKLFEEARLKAERAGMILERWPYDLAA